MLVVGVDVELYRFSFGVLTPPYRNLRAKGISCRDYFAPAHLQPSYQELGYREGDFPVTEAVASRTIALPFHNNLSEGEVEYVVSQLKDLL